MSLLKNVLSVYLMSLLAACGSSADHNVNAASTEDELNNNTDTVVEPESPPKLVTEDKIKLNQVGYLPLGEKFALVPNVDALTFRLKNAETGEIVYTNSLSNTITWQPAGNQQVKSANFTDFDSIGRFIISVDGVTDSAPFDIAEDLYASIHDAALKSFYFNRASTGLLSEHAGEWARPAGHLDKHVLVHSSAATADLPVSSVIQAAKGWYDAGDYGKYVVNSGIATYTLLAAFENYSTFYQARDIDIPESNNGVPDILDEVKWNLDWLATMQAPDGSVFHKLTTLKWPGQESPLQDQRQRYVIGLSTSAALDFAATMSMASRIFKPHDANFANVSDDWLMAAEAAWKWAKLNSDRAYTQPADVESGEYADSYFDDEFSWASAELYLSTGKAEYLASFLDKPVNIQVPNWKNVSALGVFSLIHHGKDKLPASLYEQLTEQLLALADSIQTDYQHSSFKVAMNNNDFVWGSNSVALNKAMVLSVAYNLTKEYKYRDAMIGSLSYVLGRNPTGYSFVTGFGMVSPQFPHHRISDSDSVKMPIPGMLVGGPHSGQQDGCNYSSNLPALSYLDHWCSFSTNEIAINWNAPLVYVLAAIQND